MKRIRLGILGFVLLVGFICFIALERQDLYGTYTFQSVSYLSPLSSNTKDYVNVHMAYAKYTIKPDLFKIETSDASLEIVDPCYVKGNIKPNSTALFNVRTLDDHEVRYQYTIYHKDGSSAHLRIYTSSNQLWIASYADNTSNGSEIIMNIYKLL